MKKRRKHKYSLLKYFSQEWFIWLILFSSILSCKYQQYKFTNRLNQNSKSMEID